MSYVKKALNADEKIVYQAHVSLWNFMFIYAAIALLMLLLVTAYKTGAIMGIALILLILAYLAARILVIYHGTELALTDRRLIYKTGLVSRFTNEIDYSKIESIQVSQSVLGRLLDYGAIHIGGVGSEGILARGIAHPLRFREAFGGISGERSVIR